MPRRSRSRKRSKKQKDIDWAADDHFDKLRSMIYIEHTTECPIFTTKADEFQKYLAGRFPERMFQLVRNKNGKIKPRLGAFEIEFSQNARTSKYNLWSGIDKGPPRKDKFPTTYDMLLPDVEKILKKFYPDVRPEEPILDETMPEMHFGDVTYDDTEPLEE